MAPITGSAWTPPPSVLARHILTLSVQDRARPSYIFAAYACVMSGTRDIENLKGGSIRCHCLLQPRRPALAFPERQQRVGEVVLRFRPSEPHAFARPFLQRVTTGHDCLLEVGGAALALFERQERVAEVVLCRRPV